MLRINKSKKKPYSNNQISKGLHTSISWRESVKPVQEILSIFVSIQSPLSWLQNPSEQATSEPSGELIREDDPDIISQHTLLPEE